MFSLKGRFFVFRCFLLSVQQKKSFKLNICTLLKAYFICENNKCMDYITIYVYYEVCMMSSYDMGWFSMKSLKSPIYKFRCKRVWARKLNWKTFLHFFAFPIIMPRVRKADKMWYNESGFSVVTSHSEKWKSSKKIFLGTQTELGWIKSTRRSQFTNGHSQTTFSTASLFISL